MNEEPEISIDPEKELAKLPLVYRILGRIEALGNKLPHPAILFVILAVLVVILSAITAYYGTSVIHPGTGEEIKSVSLLNREGLHRILTSLVANFTGFAPLGVVVVAILGISVAEASGFISAIIRLVVIKAPARLLTAVVIFAGVISNVASDVGYVVVVPLGAVIFYAVGRHPLVGDLLRRWPSSAGRPCRRICRCFRRFRGKYLHRCERRIDGGYHAGRSQDT